MTTTIRGTDNTAAAPALTGTDTDTGIFFPAADTIAFAEGGAEIARFDSSGNFGIGTNSPASRLHVTGLARICDASAYLLFRNAADSTSNGVVQFPDSGDASVVNYRNTDLTLGANNTTHARITAAGLFQFNSDYGSVATAYGCRAWINFNGTGTPAIRASGNVSSITDNGTGDYTINFSTAISDANYNLVSAIGSVTTTNVQCVLNVLQTTQAGGATLKSTSQVRIATANGSTGAKNDNAESYVSIFR
jgi:hypothetical protein